MSDCYPASYPPVGGQSVNPSTGTAEPAWRCHSIQEVHERINACWQAHLQWKQTPPPARAAIFNKLAELLRARSMDYARLMAGEMGKPVSEGILEIEKCAVACDYYSGKDILSLLERKIPTDFSSSYTCLSPLGVILLIMPWNFPFWQVFRAALPPLLTGNGIALKHAPNVPVCAMAIECLFREAGLPSHLLSLLMIPNPEVASVISHPLIQGISVTGSTRTGKKVASLAGTHLKKTVLELGGSDPYILFADADLDIAAQECVKGRMVNGGQSCIAAKRLLVDASIADEFTQRIQSLLSNYRMGDPLDAETQLGPMAREDLRDTLHHQVTRSVAQGATLVIGGEIPEQSGWFYPPTLLTHVRPGMPVFDEETFGPVTAVCPFHTREEAWALANRTPYGLGAAVFSQDTTLAEAEARQHLQCGAIFINTSVRSDPRLPFGGIKHSGYGRELGEAALYEFANLQTIVQR